MNKEAKVTLFAVVSLAVLVGVVWYRQHHLDRQREMGIDPLEKRLEQIIDSSDDHAPQPQPQPPEPLPAPAPRPQDAGPQPPDDDHPAPTPQPQPVAPSAPQPTVHVVQPGESLWVISKKYFGDATHVKEIFEANSDKLKDPHRVGAGQKLIIPSRERPGAAPPAPAQQPPQAPQPPPQPERNYTVVRGDTLVSIARRFYNDPTKSSKIFAANRDKLSDPNVLAAGVTLRIPQP